MSVQKTPAEQHNLEIPLAPMRACPSIWHRCSIEARQISREVRSYRVLRTTKCLQLKPFRKKFESSRVEEYLAKDSPNCAPANHSPDPPSFCNRSFPPHGVYSH